MSEEELHMLMFVGITSCQKLEKYSIQDTHLFRGIYFLFEEKKVVYVGISRNVMKRIEQHKKEGVKVFNSFAYFLTPTFNDKDLRLLEKTYIQTQRPKYNIQGSLN